MTLIMNDKYKRIIEMSALPLMLLFLSAVALTFLPELQREKQEQQPFRRHRLVIGRRPDG